MHTSDSPSFSLHALHTYQKKYADWYTQWVQSFQESYQHHGPATVPSSQGVQCFFQDMHNQFLHQPQGFKVGDNLATTPGKVVYKTPLFELIAYQPINSKVYTTPLLLIPPWINKFYIFDMQSHNSMVQWILRKGFSLFVISWAHPQIHTMNQVTFWDYLIALKEALACIKNLTQSPQSHALGYCLGGNLLSFYSVWRPNDLVTSTYMATLFDGTIQGNLELFTHPLGHTLTKPAIKHQGYLDGRYISYIFQCLKPKEMIWNTLFKHYIQGQPFPSIDFLYWNGDYVHVPAPVHFFVVERLFGSNAFLSSSGISGLNHTFSWKNNTVPSCIIAAEQDHIVPWHASYAGAWSNKDYASFILTMGGHVAGMINPPKAKKYLCFDQGTLHETPESWKEEARKKVGSWWPRWMTWLSPYAGRPLHPHAYSSYPCLDHAPGSYALK